MSVVCWVNVLFCSGRAREAIACDQSIRWHRLPETSWRRDGIKKQKTLLHINPRWIFAIPCNQGKPSTVPFEASALSKLPRRKQTRSGERLWKVGWGLRQFKIVVRGCKGAGWTSQRTIARNIINNNNNNDNNNDININNNNNNNNDSK